MIKVEQLRDFVSVNFTNAIISGNMKNDKIDLNLKLDLKEKSDFSIPVYNVDLEQIRKDSDIVFQYLLEKYLEYNTIVGVQYFVSDQKNNDDMVFIINSLNSNLKIILNYDCINLLPNDFVSKLELSKKEGILKTLDRIDIDKFVLHNFDGDDLGRNYKTGLKKDLFEEHTYHYYALRVQDVNGVPIHYDSELSFVLKILELLMTKDNVNFENLSDIDDLFKEGYYDSSAYYELTDNISFKGKTNSDLFIYASFLKEYLKSYKDEYRNNQMKLVLKRKGE